MALRKSLFCHQLSSIYQMESLENQGEIWVNDTTYVKTRVGVLADMAGYGKTLSMLGLIARTLDRPYESGDDFRREVTGNDNCMRVKLASIFKVSGTLIVANASLVAQWESELSQTTLPYIVIQNKRDVLSLSGEGVILCPSNFLHYLAARFADTQFRRIVIDEPATLKISGLGSLTACFVWLMTATPYDLIVQPRARFLTDLLPVDFDLLGRIIVKNPDSFVQSSFCMPATHHTFIETTDLCPKILHGIVPDHLYAVLESGNVSRFLSHLGIKKEGQRHFLNLIADKLSESDPKLVTLKERLLNVANLECFVCADQVTLPTVTPCCHQVGCATCLTAWVSLTPTCPMCRGPILMNELTAIEVEASPSSAAVAPKSKLCILRDILSSLLDEPSGGTLRKILIYAHYEKSGKQLRTFLESKYKWNDLRGTRGHKETVLENFKQGDLNILLLTCVVDSAGFNLHNTTDVILFDKPSGYVESQVVGRALRVGRTSELKVWHIV